MVKRDGILHASPPFAAYLHGNAVLISARVAICFLHIFLNFSVTPSTKSGFLYLLLSLKVVSRHV